MEKNYPYQHTELSDLPGEVWKPVPEFEDFYLASSLGRIKALPREKRSKWGTTYWTPSQIITPVLGWRLNRSLQSRYAILKCALTDQNGKKHYFLFSRLMYATFCCPHSLRSTGKEDNIIHKDGDWFNLQATNLQKVTFCQVRKRVFIRKRQIAWLETDKERAKELTRKSLSKPVLQQSPDLAAPIWHASVTEAAKAVCGTPSPICAAIRKQRPYRGSLWSYASVSY